METKETLNNDINKNSLNKKAWIGAIITGMLAIAIAGFFGVYALMSQGSLEMNIDEGEVIYYEYGVDTELPDVVATYKREFFDSKGTKIEPSIVGEYDLTKLGTYEVTYKAGYKDKICKRNVTIVVQDTTAPTIELVSSPDSFTSPAGKYAEEGYSAYDNYDGDITDAVVRVEKDDVVSYVVTDSSGNTTVVERQIVYKDVVSPVITLKGEVYSTITVGTAYVEYGYVATDDCDGDITESVTVEGTVDTNTCGVYIIKYSVTDSSGNNSVIERNVTVADMVSPVISLQGDTIMYLKLGEEYAEPGYTAIDNMDGDVSEKVETESNLDNSKVGMYTVTYRVSDATGNATEITRNVYVYEKQAEGVAINPGDKVVYLTFDDGPGPHTERLLDILDKYGVKVTFFVTNQHSDYRELIGESYRRGHTIALHTYSHDYSKIYSSEAAYYDDLQKIHDIVVAQTGVEPKIVRFPGGTSNSISKNYCVGIMSKLSQGLAYRGYLYCDWNVSSSDAGGATTADAVAANVISGIKNRKVSVVLQHDTKGYSVDAVEQIIVWGLANGYTFLPMTENTPMVHHGVNN